jgi:hypothetical protein
MTALPTRRQRWVLAGSIIASPVPTLATQPCDGRRASLHARPRTYAPWEQNKPMCQDTRHLYNCPGHPGWSVTVTLPRSLLLEGVQGGGHLTSLICRLCRDGLVVSPVRLPHPDSRPCWNVRLDMEMHCCLVTHSRARGRVGIRFMQPSAARRVKRAASLEWRPSYLGRKV